MAETARRSSDRNLKRKTLNDDISDSKKFRSCDKAGCCLSSPTCCIISNDTCTRSGYTSRWYHMSLGEHFCNNCFDNFYRIGKPGYQEFSSWSHEWTNTARASKPTIKRFVSNELLPYWLKCTSCNKWRSLRVKGTLNLDYMQNFKCNSNSNEPVSCEIPEDSRAEKAKHPEWITQLVEEPLLKCSPAGPYLKRFLSEDIGLCPIECSDFIFGEKEDIEPFYIGQCGESPIWVKPDELDDDESTFAKHALVFSPTYLGLRNLIVTVWNMSPCKWLTSETISPYVNCRGLVRIYLITISEQIIDLLTKKGVINYGLLQPPENYSFGKKHALEVIVIGAGISGLAAGKHLGNLGINVKILEAKSEPFGRLQQDLNICSDGVIISGLTNNPFTILATQAGKKFQTLENDFMVFEDDGSQVPISITERVDHELYGLIHGALEWAMLKNEDSNWNDTILKNYREMCKMGENFCEPDVFNVFLKQFEIEQRADLRNLTLLNWEFVTPLVGNDGILPDGFTSIASHLTKNIEIIYDSKVEAVDYSSEGVKVVTSDKEYIASKVIVTVPVSVLRSNHIKFIPPLPESKLKAFDSIGDYYCEKLILEFPKKFWTRKIREPFGKFSVVCSDENFFLFMDITHKRKNITPTLLTYISQSSLESLKDLKDEEVVKKCVLSLKKVFSADGIVPDPTKWLLSNWRNDIYGGSFGSYIKVGKSQTAYDELSESIDKKLFFAGEATFRNIPCTLTGAYLSGLREASKILKAVET